MNQNREDLQNFLYTSKDFYMFITNYEDIDYYRKCTVLNNISSLVKRVEVYLGIKSNKPRLALNSLLNKNMKNIKKDL